MRKFVLTAAAAAFVLSTAGAGFAAAQVNTGAVKSASEKPDPAVADATGAKVDAKGAKKAAHTAKSKAKTAAHKSKVAAEKAEDAAETAKSWVARRGRQQFTGDRSSGTPDPGMVAVATILRDLCTEFGVDAVAVNA